MTKIFLSLPVPEPEKVAPPDNLKETELANLFNKYVSTEEIKVAQTSFYDLGFDPDFSVDGNVFYKKQPPYKEQPDFNFFHFLIKMVCNVVKYFLQTPKERAFQELVQIEKKWYEAGINKRMLYFPAQDEMEKDVMTIDLFRNPLAQLQIINPCN